MYIFVGNFPKLSTDLGLLSWQASKCYDNLCKDISVMKSSIVYQLHQYLTLQQFNINCFPIFHVCYGLIIIINNIIILCLNPPGSEIQSGRW